MISANFGAMPASMAKSAMDRVQQRKSPKIMENAKNTKTCTHFPGRDWSEVLFIHY